MAPPGPGKAQGSVSTMRSRLVERVMRSTVAVADGGVKMRSIASGLTHALTRACPSTQSPPLSRQVQKTTGRETMPSPLLQRCAAACLTLLASTAITQAAPYMIIGNDEKPG